ncbi:MAG: hypothetical protein DRI95_11935 [Bacteroidetes bacterium]|nr:MAG: hypothetical protein DRI95_11935 [Bacteroidota bacterium]
MRDLKFKIQPPKKGDKVARLYLAGDLSVNNLNDMVVKFREAEKDYDNIEINLNEIVAFDLATIQLLVSTKKTCLRHKKKVNFNIDISNELMKLLNITGFASIIKSL